MVTHNSTGNPRGGSILLAFSLTSIQYTFARQFPLGPND